MSEFTVVASEACGIDQETDQAELLAQDIRNKTVEHFFEAYQSIEACSDLRDRTYHLDAFDAFADCLLEHQQTGDRTIRAALTWPPGAGKTYFAARLMQMCGAGKELVEGEPRRRWLYVTHETRIADQTAEVVNTIAPELRVGNMHDRRDDNWDIMPLTIQKLCNEYENYKSGLPTTVPFEDVDLIFDEPDCYALGSATRPIIEELQQGRISVGMTATPELSTGQSTYELFPEGIANIGMREAIEVYGISPTTLIYTIKTGEVIKVNTLSVDGDISNKDLQKLADNATVNSFVVRIAKLLAGHNVPSMIFGFQGDGSDHPRQIANELDGAEVFDRMTTRKRMLAARAIGVFNKNNAVVFNQMGKGDLDVITSALMGQSGLSLEQIQAVLLVRTSVSSRIVAQQSGRPGRFDPTKPGAPSIIIHFDVAAQDKAGQPIKTVTPYDVFDVEPQEDGPTVIQRKVAVGRLRPPVTAFERPGIRDFRRTELHPIVPPEQLIAQAERVQANYAHMMQELRKVADEAKITVAERTRITTARQMAEGWDVGEVAKLTGDIAADHIVRVLRKSPFPTFTIRVDGQRKPQCSDEAMEWLDENVATRHEYTKAEIAARLQVSHGVVERALAGLVLDDREGRRKYRRQFQAGSLRLPHYSEAVVQKVADNIIDPIQDNEISVQEIHEATGLSYDTIHRRFTDLQVSPRNRRLKQGGTTNVYSREAYTRMIAEKPVAERWDAAEGLVTAITVARRLKHYGIKSADVSKKAEDYGIPLVQRINGTRTADCMTEDDVEVFVERYKEESPLNAQTVARSLQVPKDLVDRVAIDFAGGQMNAHDATTLHSHTEKAIEAVKVMTPDDWQAVHQEILAALHSLKLSRPPAGKVISAAVSNRVYTRIIMLAEPELDVALRKAAYQDVRLRVAAEADASTARRKNSQSL